MLLDTFPYSGGITTCEALWMVTPVVCWPQDTFASRHSLSHATNAGFTEGIAQDGQHYVDIVKRWTANPAGLSKLREGLRPTMSQSPLCRLNEFVRDWSSAIRHIWRTSVGIQNPPFNVHSS